MFNTLTSTDELAAHLGDPHWVIIDCRFTLSDPSAGRAAYQAGHIPGAFYAHLDEDLAGPVVPGVTGRHPLPDPKVLSEKLCRWGVGINRQVVVYDDSYGSIAARLWWMIRWLGHPSVSLMDGGYQKWAREKRPVTAETWSAPAHGICPSLPERSQWLSSAEVLDQMRSGQGILFDSRMEMRFTGEVDPIDPVAGHVPGAINWPFDENLDMDGTFLAPEALRETYQALLKGTPPERVTHMCGSGVTACHSLLAMEVAGLPGSKLYAGSWSEWINDPTRPIATGE
jgi:thiosulfate/3-mercaptopyruvate sulfurtransferase